ncbi:helix-turn-helix transcriptional regulator [Raoultibacter massiliensis]|uniref:helix-turn-helix transcriptional regulator n=1 Tax=Raoultibacter massiliensis TaxID=1852371 RepID=UPI000C85866F|nr:LuxR C-terminal-related transcriptional regulator [Raoultibacter massiliensis]
MGNDTQRIERALDKDSFALASIGLGLCIASTEALRYSALWRISDEGALDVLLIKIVSLTAVFSALILLSKKPNFKPHESTWMLVAIALLQTIGFAMQISATLHPVHDHLFTIVQRTVLESSYILFIAFASFFLGAKLRAAIQALVIGIIIAGTIQIAIPFVSFEVASALILLLTPASCACLVLAVRKQRASDEWLETLPENERAEFDDAPSEAAPLARSSNPGSYRIPLWQLCLTIALFSFIVSAIHLQWLQAQDGESASTIIQICAGVGAILAGNLLLLARNSLQGIAAVDSVRLLVLPIALATLYVASLLSGALIALSVIPLNITYVAVLFLAWIIPFVYRFKRTALFACASLFLAKKLGVVVGLGIMRDLAKGDADWIGTTMIVATLFALIVLSVMHFFKMGRQEPVSPRGKEEPAIDSETALSLACESMSKQYKLTKREGEVLALLARGRSATYIAEALVISSTTAKTHVKHIYQKVGIASKQVLLDIVEDELNDILAAHGKKSIN